MTGQAPRRKWKHSYLLMSYYYHYHYCTTYFDLLIGKRLFFKFKLIRFKLLSFKLLLINFINFSYCDDNISYWIVHTLPHTHTQKSNQWANSDQFDQTGISISSVNKRLLIASYQIHFQNISCDCDNYWTCMYAFYRPGVCRFSNIWYSYHRMIQYLVS